MHGHGDSVTGLSLSSEGSYLLSNSMDNTGGVGFHVAHNVDEFCCFRTVCLSHSADLGRATVRTQGEMREDFPG